MSSVRIYHLRIVPPEPVYSAIVNFKQQFIDRYGKQKYSKSKPHITLALFKMDTEFEPEMVACFEQLSSIKSFSLQITGFKTFEDDALVLFLDIAHSSALEFIYTQVYDLWQKNLQESISKLTISKTPHITISNVNDKKTLDECFNTFKGIDYRTRFEVDHLVLTSRVNGKTWDWEHHINLHS